MSLELDRRRRQSSARYAGASPTSDWCTSHEVWAVSRYFAAHPSLTCSGPIYASSFWTWKEVDETSRNRREGPVGRSRGRRRWPYAPHAISGTTGGRGERRRRRRASGRYRAAATAAAQLRRGRLGSTQWPRAHISTHRHTHELHALPPTYAQLYSVCCSSLQQLRRLLYVSATTCWRSVRRYFVTLMAHNLIYWLKLEKKLPSIEADRGQTERVTTTTRTAWLHRCRLPRPRHAVRLAAIARSWRRHYGKPLLCSSVNSQRTVRVDTYVACAFCIDLWLWPLTLTLHGDWVSYGHDPCTCKNQVQR